MESRRIPGGRCEYCWSMPAVVRVHPSDADNPAYTVPHCTTCGFLPRVIVDSNAEPSVLPPQTFGVLPGEGG